MNGKKYEIKGLVWETLCKNKAKEQHISETIVGIYYVERERKRFWVSSHRMPYTTCESIEDGKAKAEADLLARILPALEEVKEGES